MPAERVSMRRIREILRLKYEGGATERAIARSIGVARSTVALTLERIAAAQLGWPLPPALSDAVLEAMLYASAGRSVLHQPLHRRPKNSGSFSITKFSARRPSADAYGFVDDYNHRRYHESIGNLTPADAHFGRGHIILAERERIKRQTIADRRLQHQLHAA